MSVIYKGEIIESNLSKNSKGGTEMMRGRIIRYVESSLLEHVAIHLSRPRTLYDDVKNIFYAHDLPGDPENRILENDGWKVFSAFVFVSQTQMDGYLERYAIPKTMCRVIENAIETGFVKSEKPTDRVRFIYHTTPHRGLALLYPVIDKLSKEFPNILLNVYSSFSIYGWNERDKPYLKLFEMIANHPNMNYHGVVSNPTILKKLSETNYFLYPCIWEETSCIALIEAMKNGCFCIHPEFGALSETSSGYARYVYDYSKDPSTHATTAYQTIRTILKQDESIPGIINNIVNHTNNKQNSRHSIDSFRKKWSLLLQELQ